MKIQTFRLMIILAALTPFHLVASAQRDSTRLSPEKVKSMGLLTATKDEKQKAQIISIASKKLNVDQQALAGKPAALNYLTPDLTITYVHVRHAKFQPDKIVVTMENKGSVDAGPCKLRFMYGMTWDSLESMDFDVPAIAAGKASGISFPPPDQSVHWWMFGVDVDNKLGEANFSNNLFVIEFKDAPK